MERKSSNQKARQTNKLLRAASQDTVLSIGALTMLSLRQPKNIHVILKKSNCFEFWFGQWIALHRLSLDRVTPLVLVLRHWVEHHSNELSCYSRRKYPTPRHFLTSCLLSKKWISFLKRNCSNMIPKHGLAKRILLYVIKAFECQQR